MKNLNFKIQESKKVRFGTARFLKRLFEENTLVIGNTNTHFYAKLDLSEEFEKLLKQKHIWLMDNRESDNNAFYSTNLVGIFYNAYLQSDNNRDNTIIPPCTPTKSALKLHEIAMIEIASLLKSAMEREALEDASFLFPIVKELESNL